MPTSQYQQLRTRFDAGGLNRYDITTDDLQCIERYIHILQSGLSKTVWDEAVQIGGPYGTSILIHEIVEIRTLQQAGIDPYDTDLNYLLESGIGVFLLEQDRVEEAKAYLEQLRQGGV